MLVRVPIIPHQVGKTKTGTIRSNDFQPFLALTLSMARTGDPHSATSRFFINPADNAFLDKAGLQDGWSHAVFGKVGRQEAADRIAAV